LFWELGRFVLRYRLWFVLVWVGLGVFMAVAAPSLQKVGGLDVATFLPRDTESFKARELLGKHFPEAGAISSGTLVFYDPSGLSQEDLNYAGSLRDWLLSPEAPSTVESVTSIFDHPQLKGLLVSPDDTTMLMHIGFSKPHLEAEVQDAVREIRSYIGSRLRPPAGLEVHVSGQAGIAADMFDAVRKSVDRTTIATIILVIVLLLLIYRSPVLILVPLLTIGIAYTVGRGALGYLAQAGVNIWSQVDAFLIVLVFGVGTDYCLFILSRFNEELGRGRERSQANLITIERVGAVITASALAVIVGLIGLGAGRLEMIRTMGPSLGLAIFITLLAALTLTPSLTSLFGRILFWPRRGALGRGGIGAVSWAGIARLISRHPGPSLIIVAALLLTPYIALPHLQRTFNTVRELPQEMDSVRGFRTLEEHYDVGEMMPLSAVLALPKGEKATAPEALAALAGIGRSLQKVEGVSRVYSPVQPGGEVSPMFKASGQLLMLRQKLEGVLSGGGAGMMSPGALGAFSDLESYLDELARAFPWVKEDPAYLRATGIIGELKQGMSRMSPGGGFMEKLGPALRGLAGSLGELASGFREKGDPYFFPESLLRLNPQAEGLRAAFLSPDGEAVRLSVVLDSYPYSPEAFEVVRKVRKALKEAVVGTPFERGEVAVGGPSAQLADVQRVIDEDFRRVAGVVLAGIFIVLVILLRGLIAPLYLLATVLLSYGTTLGLVAWLFQDILGHEGINYIIPIILFVLLVALGEDYNIFLMSRVREEWQETPSREAVRRALTATGGIITACGIILAGTFAAMTTAPIQSLLQIGTAIALGILIDTFIVRAALVPSIAAMLGRWNWLPFRG